MLPTALLLLLIRLITLSCAVNAFFRQCQSGYSFEHGVALNCKDGSEGYLISPSSPFLRELGITTEDGRVRTSGAPKHNQMQRFVEIVDGLVRQSGRAPHSPLAVADMGCGAGYLTFASHQHFSREFQVRTVGVEARLSLVSKANAVAASCGIAGLEFVQGTIETVRLDHADVVMALDACGTASDFSIWKGIRMKSDVIAIAPCCYRDKREALKSAHSRAQEHAAYFARTKPPHRHWNKARILHAVIRDGLQPDRLTEMVTDTCRALVLEMSGYDCKVFEFVGGEHTAKNVMIAATRSARARSQEELSSLQRTLRILSVTIGEDFVKYGYYI